VKPPLFIDSAGETFGRVLATRTVEGFVFRKSRYRRGLRMPLHCHPHAYLSFVVAGGLDEHDSGGARRYGPGSLHFHPAEDHHSVSTGDRELVCMSIIPSHSGAASLGSRLASPRRGPLGGEVTRLAARCHHEFEADDSASELALEGVALELVATLIRTRTPSERHAPGWLEESRDYVHEHYRERVLLSSLSQLTGVHEVHLVRMFRRHFGTTPGAYVRRLRIERACDALVRPESNIVQIALDAGYSSQAHFTRVFRRLMGATPAAYRRANRTRG
jgi:AraC family transcriptional regulator